MHYVSIIYRYGKCLKWDLSSGDWSKTGAVFSAEDLALLDSTGRPTQVNKQFGHQLFKFLKCLQIYN